MLTKEGAKSVDVENVGKKKEKRKNLLVIISHSVSHGIFYICPKKTRKRRNY